jgi:hypothetical protein
VGSVGFPPARGQFAGDRVQDRPELAVVDADQDRAARMRLSGLGPAACDHGKSYGATVGSLVTDERVHCTTKVLRVELLYFDGCPNHEALLPRLQSILTRTGIPAEIQLLRIGDDAAAQREHFLGSPTVRVNGRDVEPDAERRTDFGLKCRLYRTCNGLSGQPQEEWLRAALHSTTGADH